MTEEEKEAKRLEDEAKAEAKRLADEKAKEDYEKLTADEKLAVDIRNGVDEALKPIKENLDKVYAERDSALKVVKEYQDKEKEAKLAALKAAGKDKEIFDLKMQEKDDENAKLKKANLKLTRDTKLKSALGVLEFRNESAFNMAYNEIKNELVEDEDGKWKHKSGASIKDYVKTYSTSEDHTFLFKQKISSGGGGKPPSKKKTGGESTSLFNKTQAEVIQLAKDGKLNK